jgi:autotransporter-associated beta strand protein
MATISTWKATAASPFYNDTGNWNASVPGASDTGEFEASDTQNITVNLASAFVDQWVFNPGAIQYNFDIPYGSELNFSGAGITINAGSVNLFNFGQITFFSNSTPGGASIDNFQYITFANSSNAGTAVIHTYGGGFGNGGAVIFLAHSSAGSAQLVTDAGGIVDFSHGVGTDGHGHVSAGSIAGGGDYFLGFDQLTVGSNGLSTTVSGHVDDGGAGGHAGASLVKVGPGTLTLSGAGNTYSGGTTLVAGALHVAALGAAGTGAITFATVGKTKATLDIDNAALSAHHFGNPIDNFGKHDFLDLTGLHFHAGATATYHKGNHHLTIHSGHVTDTLTLLSPHGTHFATASDHHGGTEVFLVFA